MRTVHVAEEPLSLATVLACSVMTFSLLPAFGMSTRLVVAEQTISSPLATFGVDFDRELKLQSSRECGEGDCVGNSDRQLRMKYSRNRIKVTGDSASSGGLLSQHGKTADQHDAANRKALRNTFIYLSRSEHGLQVTVLYRVACHKAHATSSSEKVTWNLDRFEVRAVTRSIYALQQTQARGQ